MRLALLSLVALAVTACSSTPRTPDYECPLHDTVSAKCASMADSYKASRNMQRTDSGRVQSVFEAQGQPGGPEAAPVLSNQPSNFPEPGQTGMPVFQQPKVMRAWVAPYVDADGNLRSGEYVYFSTPGQWNYGSMKKPGAGSGIFEPGKPSNLGFTPNTQQKTSGSTASRTPTPIQSQGTPARPPESAQNAVNNNAPQMTRSTETVGSVTQPYQRLAN